MIRGVKQQIDIIIILQQHYVTLLHLKSKEITGVHMPCVPHSNDSWATTEYQRVYVEMYHWNVWTSSVHNTLSLRLATTA